MTSKEALESVKHFVSSNHPQESVYLCETEEYKQIEKDLEVLEIIKKRQIDIPILLIAIRDEREIGTNGLVFYNRNIYHDIFLTEKKYNLLKEWLENEKTN